MAHWSALYKCWETFARKDIELKWVFQLKQKTTAKCSFFVNQLMFLIKCHAVQPFVEVMDVKMWKLIKGGIAYCNIFEDWLFLFDYFRVQKILAKNSKIRQKVFKFLSSNLK